MKNLFRLAASGMAFVMVSFFSFSRSQSLQAFDREVCPGASVFVDGGLYKILSSNCTVTSVTENGTPLDLGKVTMVQPSTTSTYVISYQDQTGSHTATAVISVVQPPVLDIAVTSPRPLPVDGLCEGTTVSFEVRKHTEPVYWKVSTEDNSVEANTTWSFELKESCKVTAQSYNICGFVDTTIHMVVNTKPDLPGMELELNTDLQGTFCSECGYFPRVDEILKGVSHGASVNSASITWADGSTTEEKMPSGTLQKRATIRAVVSLSNACGSVSGTVDTTFDLRVGRGVDCKPQIANSISLRPCQDKEISLQNLYKGLCTIQGEPVLTPGSKLVVSKKMPFPYQEPSSDLYRWQVRWENYSKADPKQTLQAEAAYRISCPYSKQEPVRMGTFRKDVEVKVDTDYLSFKYEYCPDQPAELEISGQENVVTISSVTILSAAGDITSSFVPEASGKPHKRIYKSSEPVTVAALSKYGQIRVKVRFSVDDGSCKFTAGKEEIVPLKQKGNCAMEFRLVESGKCIGEPRTLQLSNKPDNLHADSIVIGNHPVFVFQRDPLEAGALVDKMDFRPYYAGAPGIASREDSISVTLYYHMTGSTQPLSLTKRFNLKVDACPPYFQGQVVVSERNCPMCPGMAFSATIEFPNMETSPRLSKVDLVSTGANRMDPVREAWNLTRVPQYMLRRYLFDDMDYHVTVTYNEGDSIYHVPVLTLMQLSGQPALIPFTIRNLGELSLGEAVDNTSIGMADVCSLINVPEPDSVCQGDIVDLYVYSQNFFDTLKSIEWSDAGIRPVGTGLEDWTYEYKDGSGKLKTRKMKRFHYTVRAQVPGVYPFKVRTKIRDTAIVRHDTLRIAVIEKPRIFIRDTVWACDGQSLDLGGYVDGTMITNLQCPQGLQIPSATSGDYRVATADLRYQCSAGSTIKDTIVIMADLPVYNAFIADQEHCPADTVTLRAGTNGRVTWTRRRKMPGGGLSEADTLYLDGENKAIFDVMGGESHLYTVTARTGCSTPPPVTIQFWAHAKPEPQVSIIDNSACRPAPLVLATRPFDPAQVDSLQGVKWYVDGRAYALPSVPPSDRITVVCAVRGLNGCSKSDTIEMRSYASPSVRIGVYGEPDFPGRVYCAGQGHDVHFTGQGAESYDWYKASSPGSISTAGDYIFKVDKDDTLYLVGKESGKGCSARDSIFVYLEPSAKVTEDTLACNGEGLSILPEAGADVSYEWFHPDGTSICSCTALTFTPYEPADTGVYTVKFTRKECEVSRQVHLRMYPVPNFDFTDSGFCDQEPLTLDVVTGLDAEWLGKSRFAWYDKAGNLLQDKIGQTRYEGNALTLADSGLYRLEVMVDRCHSMSDVYVRVDPHSQPDFTLDSFYCEGADLNTRALDQGPDAEYFWYSGNRPHGNFNASPNIGWGGLTLEDSADMFLVIRRGACLDTARRFVHVRSLPRPGIVALDVLEDAGGKYFCEGSPMRLEAENVRAGDDMTWSYPDSVQPGSFVHIAAAAIENAGWYALHVKRNGCQGRDSVYIGVRVVPVPMVNDTFMCSGVTLVMDASDDRYPGSVFQWMPSGETGSSLAIRTGGKYSVVMVYDGCRGEKSFDVEERPSPYIGFEEEITICQRDSVLLSGPAGMDTYLWQDGSSGKDYIVKSEGFYSLHVEKDGCSDYAEVNVYEDFCSNLYFPSAFTPNGDGVNDRFGPLTTAVDEQVVYVLQVFNRNGEKVFESHSLQEGWDGKFKGKDCPGGVYIYHCRAHAKKNGRKLSADGSVTLIR